MEASKKAHYTKYKRILDSCQVMSQYCNIFLIVTIQDRCAKTKDRRACT